MDFNSLISRINFLYHKSQGEGLTEEEKKEQAALKKEYIECFKSNFRAQLETIKKVPDPNIKH
jgi:uncharacterized protein YnzC (UPF0291/DUF896 family)